MTYCLLNSINYTVELFGFPLTFEWIFLQSELKSRSLDVVNDLQKWKGWGWRWELFDFSNWSWCEKKTLRSTNKYTPHNSERKKGTPNLSK